VTRLAPYARGLRTELEIDLRLSGNQPEAFTKWST